VPLPLSNRCPIWIESSVGSPARLIAAATPDPVRHRYCEITFVHAGTVRQHVGLQSFSCGSGDVLLWGPEMPHWCESPSSELRTTSIFFLPRLLVEIGPACDGAKLLSLCGYARRSGGNSFRPEPELRSRLDQRLRELAQEFAEGAEGAELLLRSLLLEILAAFSRRQARLGWMPERAADATHWNRLHKALSFAHDHYADPIYVQQLAIAAGISVARVQESFQATLGMKAMEYLQWYRLTRAQAQLSLPGARVAEVALEVGFETLSHFNASFRKWFGMSPTEYMRQSRNRYDGSALASEPIEFESTAAARGWDSGVISGGALVHA